MSSPTKDILAQALDLHSWLEADRGTPAVQRAERDRGIGIETPDLSPTERVLYWWSHIDSATAPSAGVRLVTVRFWLSAALCFVGMFVGGSLSSLALAYEGDYPINVLTLLGVLVGLPGLLLLITVISAVMRSMGLKPLAAALSTFNVNRWVLGFWDRYTGAQLGSSLGRNNAHGRLAFWQVALFSQWFGAGFYLGVVLMFGALLAFTDLAFGWSSTLDIDPASIRRWVLLLAWPWSQWWPVAVPDMALIEASRIYRLELSAVDLDPGLLRSWWPFVLMTILVWGMLPRGLMLALAIWRGRAAAYSYLTEHSEVSALLDRMSTPIVDLGRHSEDTQQAVQALQSTPTPVIPLSSPAVVDWNGALPGAQLSGQVNATMALSSLQDESERGGMVASLASMISAADGVVVITKGWEPPLLEFLDLLQQVRASVGEKLTIVVTPVGLPEVGLSATDQMVWQQTVARLGDPHTYVVAEVVSAERVTS